MAKIGFKIIIAINMLFIILVSVLYTSLDENMRNSQNQHRLQWWLKYINWDNDSREERTIERQVTIALIDSGVDRHHPDIKNAKITEFGIMMTNDEILYDNNKDYEHGTAMAAILVAKPNTKEGVLGINPDCEILSLDVSTNVTDVNVERLKKAIEFAIAADVDVINISAAMGYDDEELHQVIREAYNKNITIVASSGNDNDKIKYPAAYEEVIAVNGIDKKGNIMYQKKEYDVLAPGKNIVTAHANIDSEDIYISIDGTSASAAIVSGIVSLIYQYNPEVSNEDIYNYFRENKENPLDVEQTINNLCK